MSDEALPAVTVKLGPEGYTSTVYAGRHELIADEPASVGGDDQGPTPYDLLLASLGACTAMTLRMYAARKGLPLDGVIVQLRHDRIHANDCETCETQEGKLDRIQREIQLQGALDTAQHARLLEIAERCPVHRTLQSEIVISTLLREPPATPPPGQD